MENSKFDSAKGTEEFTKMAPPQVMNFSLDFSAFVMPFDLPHVKGIYVCLFGIIFLCCVLGNLTVIYVILRHRKMRNVTNFFLANLAVSDLCVGVFCVLPNLSTYLSTEWYLGRVMCKLYYFVQCTSYTASVLILTVISLERYFAIIHPMLNRRVTRMYYLRIILIIVWISAGVYGLPNLIAYDIVSVPSGAPDNSTIEFCVITGDWDIDMEIYSVVNFVLLYLLPLMLISAVYIRISVVLWRTSQATSGGLSSSGGQAKSKTSVIYYHRTQLKCQQCGSYVHFNKLNNGNDTNDELHNAEDTWKTRWLSCLSGKGSRWARPVEYEADDDSSSCGCAKPVQMSNDSTNHLQRPCSLSDNSSKRRVSLHNKHREPKPKPSNALTTRRKVIRLLICIIVSFAISVLPHHVRVLWMYWSPPVNSFSFGHMLIPPTTFLLFYANAALNPFLYALLSDHFRRAFRDVLPSCCRRGAGGRDMTLGRDSRMMLTNSYSDGQSLQVTRTMMTRLSSSRLSPSRLSPSEMGSARF